MKSLGLRSICLLAAIAMLLGSVPDTAEAVQSDWVPPADGVWNDGGNWSMGVPVDSGGTVAFLHQSGQTITVDLNGTPVNLGSSRVEFRHGNWTVDDLTQADPALKARLTADNIWSNNASGSHTFNVPITANLFRTRLNPDQPVTINAPFSITTFDKGWPGSQGRETLNINASPEIPITLFKHNNWITNFNAPGTITTLDFITGHNVNTFNANAALAIGTLNMTLTPGRPDPQTFNYNAAGTTIGTLNWQYGNWMASVDGGVAALGATPTIPDGASVIVAAPQATLPTLLTVPGGTALIGDMTNFDYSGAGQNVTFGDGAVFVEQVAPAGGPLQAGDLPPGVQVYRGILTPNENATSDAPGTAYKGIGFGKAYTSSGELSGTYTSGGGDLNIRIDGAMAAHYNNGPYFIGDGTSTTANFEMGPTGALNIRRAFNHTGGSSATQIADPNQILTFNFTRDPGNERVNIFTSSQQGRVFANQTINVSNGRMGLAGVLNMGIEGAVSLTDGTWDINTPFSALDTGTLALAGRTTLELALGGQVRDDALEPLGGFSYSGLPMVIFSDNNSMNIYDWDYASNPVFADFMKNVDYGSNHYHNVDIGGVGLYIGDGKFLADAGTAEATDEYVAHNTTGTLPKILPGQPGAITMGFAASVKNLGIGLEVDAPEATIQVGTTDPNRLLKAGAGNTGFVAAGVPTMRVTFQEPVTAAGVRVESGTAQFNHDLTTGTVNVFSDAVFTMANNTTATVSDLLTGAGAFGGGNGIVLGSGGTVAPGDGVGQLTGNAPLVMQGDATYEWELLDPDLTPGDGWDMFFSDSSVGFGGELDIILSDAGLTKDVTPGMRFLIADIEAFSSLPTDVNVLAGDTGWIVDPDGVDIEPDGQGGRIYISGIDTTQQGPGPDVIPEPATLSLLGLGALALLRRRRRC